MFGGFYVLAYDILFGIFTLILFKISSGGQTIRLFLNDYRLYNTHILPKIIALKIAVYNEAKSSSHLENTNSQEYFWAFSKAAFFFLLRYFLFV